MELLAAYHGFAKGYYRKNGEVTSEVVAILSVAKLVKDLYGREAANDFDPLKLQAVQQTMTRLGWTRRNINRQCQRIVRIFSWAVSQKLVKVEVVAALREVQGLHVGRTAARESTPGRHAPINSSGCLFEIRNNRYSRPQFSADYFP